MIGGVHWAFQRGRCGYLLVIKHELDDFPIWLQICGDFTDPYLFGSCKSIKFEKNPVNPIESTKWNSETHQIPLKASYCPKDLLKEELNITSII